MIILIAGTSHTGKTLLAQRLLEKYKYPYLSIDHLKMGLIRSGQCQISPKSSTDEMTKFLWPIIKEIIKTCIENFQNIIVEGCYIPFGWEKDFSPEYRSRIKYLCLIMSRDYIENHLMDIIEYENVIERRLCSDITKEELLILNAYNFEKCQQFNYDYILIDKEYQIDIDKNTL